LLFFVLALLATRLVRGWNQTGQKFAGEPDIVKIFLAPNPQVLWVLVGATYVWLFFRTTAHVKGLPTPVSAALVSVLVLSAFSFKVAFTNEDAPELVVGFAKSANDALQGWSLVARARLVFFGLGAAAVYSVYNHFQNHGRPSDLTGRSSSNFSSSYADYFVRDTA
jgi:ethanolamine phosphate transferase 2 subunit G